MIIAVYVTYNPDLSLLRDSVNSVAKQVDYIVLVDNGSTVSVKQYLGEDSNIEYIELEENHGIGAAQNIGIGKSIELGAEYVLLSDQDTLYPERYLQDMIPAMGADPQAIAIAPKYFDVLKQVEVGFVGLESSRFKKVNPQEGIHRILHAMASGMVIKVKLLEHAGLMDENLFIDWVDLEWCWRANHRGLRILGNANIMIRHTLGYRCRQVINKKVSIHNPLRHYYITRNALYLSLYTKSLDRRRRFFLFISSVKYLIFYPLLFSPHLQNLRAVSSGFYHGAMRKLGPSEL